MKPSESTFSEPRREDMKIAEPKSWNAFFENNEGYWGLFLLFLAISAHAYSIVVTGAKFWIDSIVYFHLALALLFDREGCALHVWHDRLHEPRQFYGPFSLGGSD